MVIDLTRRLANGVLDEHWDKKFPVNAVQIAYKAGFTVSYDTTLSDDDFAAVLTHDNEIRVNPLNSTVRQRIGIFVMMVRRLVGYSTVEEKQAANAFAVEMAMPATAVTFLKDAGMSVREMAEELDVTETIMAYRLNELFA